MTTALVAQAKKVEVRKWNSVTEIWDELPTVRCQTITECAGRNFPRATLALRTGYELGSTPAKTWRADDHTLLAEGAEILVKYADIGEAAGAVLFQGFVDCTTITIAGEGEAVFWQARSIGCRMNEAYPLGSWARGYGNFDENGDPITTGRTLCNGLPPLMNPGGIGNASKVWWQKTVEEELVDVCPLFSPEGDVTLSEKWTYRGALLYCFEHLVQESSAGNDVRTFDFPTPEELNIGVLNGYPRDYALEGRSWWENIVELCRLAGCRVQFKTSGDLDAGITSKIIVWAIGTGTAKTLKLQAVGAKLDPELSTTNRVQWQRDASGLANTPLAVGGRREYEGTWPLMPAWQTALLPDPIPTGSSYAAKYVRDGADFETYKDVGRLWLLNEAGQVSGAAYGSQTVFDLATAIPTSIFARRPRRFDAPLELRTPAARTRAPCLLQVSLDGGSTWINFTQAGYNWVAGSCGVWLSAHDLKALKITSGGTSTDFWTAVTTGAANLKLKVCATIQEDGRLSSKAEVPSGCPLARDVAWFYDKREQFLYRHRITTGAYASLLSGTADEADDAAALTTEAGGVAAQTSAMAVRGSATLVNVDFDYQVGDVLTKIAGRELSLSASGGMTGTAYPEIVTITRTFGASYTMELAFEDDSLAAVR